ncbi:DNA-binding response regulator, OmpR family, contains REC and winged-helix (wHTH) domain [Mucilaginibacter mallensis]|uniref:DNA-binding response regulator, OmpR family, contains REC and winged-helix (WHTH) domain n=1 Tax=Mucilaginibacter mallensis TaxID=652787 RepID=A0A1H1WD19_MUCMA|nr:response regulator transcription factor [Mucilaginibacter mallensis]SDS94904.1 DNA-binding response regulator, OmpR family, contains REC and winged-helix (wHTH) domain [Mucilaginibacter mallensis]
MDNITVLLAEDEMALAHIVRESLEERNFKVILCANGEQAIEQYRKLKPDVLALDIMMPKIDGFEVARQIREIDVNTPIIFITARSQIKDVVNGFEIGANDYLKKPFSVEELIVRIKALLRTKRTHDNITKAIKIDNEPLKIGDILFNPIKNTIQHNNSGIVHLTARESAVLYQLCQPNMESVPRKVLLQKIWGNDNVFNARSLDVFITKLRRHLEADPNIQLINIRGIGYKLVW